MAIQPGETKGLLWRKLPEVAQHTVDYRMEHQGTPGALRRYVSNADRLLGKH